MYTLLLDGTEVIESHHDFCIYLQFYPASFHWCSLASFLSSQWNEIQMRMGTETPVPVLQACGRSMTRTIISQWRERKDAHDLLMDVTFAQEEEPFGQLSPLQVHLFDSDTPITRFQNSWTVLDLQTSKLFPVTVSQDQISSHLNRNLALRLGSVSHRGFQIAFSYSGTCVLITSIRLYYRKCPDIVTHLALFKGVGADSGPTTGSCVKGAVEISPPVRECNVDGVWDPPQGGCTCELGHQVIDDTCQGMEIRWFFSDFIFFTCQPYITNKLSNKQYIHILNESLHFTHKQEKSVLGQWSIAESMTTTPEIKAKTRREKSVKTICMLILYIPKIQYRQYVSVF